MNKYFSLTVITALILLLILACKKEQKCSYLKDYYQQVYLAEKAFYTKDYKAVVDLMDKACSKCELLNQRGIYEMYKYAESAARIGATQKAIELIRALLLRGYDINQLAQNEGFVPLLATNEWKALETEYDSLHQSYLRGINLELRSQVKKMKDDDQYYRSLLRIAGTNRDSIEVMINRVDSINDLQFKEIIGAYGYPNEEVIGDYKIDRQHVDPGILLFHFDDYEFYTTTLKEFIEKGEAPPQSLGNFVDAYQRRVEGRKKFIYGIYDNTGKEEIIDYENLDIRRVEIGLPPMSLKRSIDSLKQAYYRF